MTRADATKNPHRFRELGPAGILLTACLLDHRRSLAIHGPEAVSFLVSVGARHTIGVHLHYQGKDEPFVHERASINLLGVEVLAVEVRQPTPEELARCRAEGRDGFLSFEVTP